MVGRTESCDPSSHSSSHCIAEANNLLNSPPRTTVACDKYINVVLHAERKGVAALRSVAEMLKKRTYDTLKRIAMYRSLIDGTDML